MACTQVCHKKTVITHWLRKIRAKSSIHAQRICSCGFNSKICATFIRRNTQHYSQQSNTNFSGYFLFSSIIVSCYWWPHRSHSKQSGKKFIPICEFSIIVWRQPRKQYIFLNVLVNTYFQYCSVSVIHITEISQLNHPWKKFIFYNTN